MMTEWPSVARNARVFGDETSHPGQPRLVTGAFELLVHGLTRGAEEQQRAVSETFSPPRNKPSLRKVESGVRNFSDAEFDCLDHEDNT